MGWLETDRRDCESIHVLLVDDDPSWTDLAIDVLSSVSSELTVEAVESKRDVLKRVEAGASDCVVSDYKMPEWTGIDLLEAIRGRRSHFPFVLVTARGNEELASRAIAAGADDYLTKSNAIEHPDLFANRIINVVTNRRNVQALAESEARYRTIVETVTEAVCVYRDGRLIYTNDRCSELLGRDDDWLQAKRAATFVHEADRRRYEEVVDGTAVTDEEIRVTDSEGTIRHCLLTAKRIVVDGEPAIICIFRDVTDQRDRERALRRELGIKETVWDVLVHHSSREEIAQTFCEQMVDEGISDLACVMIDENSRKGSTEACVLSSAGTDSDDSPTVVNPDRHRWACEPAALAVESNTPVTTELFERDEDWQKVARDRGFRAAIAVPIRHGNVAYGALSAYYSDGPVSDDRRGLLSDLAEVLGYAFDMVGVREALASNATRYVRVELTDERAALAALAACEPFRTAETRISVLLQGGSADRYYGRTSAPEAAVSPAFDDWDRVRSYGVDLAPSGETRFHVELQGPSIGETLVEQQATFESATLADRRVELTVRLPSRADVGRFVDVVGARFDGVELLASGSWEQETPSRSDLLEPLTGRQLEALRAAYFSGYFEQPKRASAEDVATELGIGRSTFTQHLRAAERKLLGTIFEGNAERYDERI